MSPDTNTSEETPKTNGSTGPRTFEGKSRSRLNSLVHGLTARDIIVTSEEELEEFEETKKIIFEQVQPTGALQMIAFNDLLHASWNKTRIQRMEADYLAQDPEVLNKPETRRLSSCYNATSYATNALTSARAKNSNTCKPSKLCAAPCHRMSRK